MWTITGRRKQSKYMWESGYVLSNSHHTDYFGKRMEYFSFEL